jgi:hypothetical protein
MWRDGVQPPPGNLHAQEPPDSSPRPVLTSGWRTARRGSPDPAKTWGNSSSTPTAPSTGSGQGRGATACGTSRRAHGDPHFRTSKLSAIISPFNSKSAIRNLKSPSPPSPLVSLSPVHRCFSATTVITALPQLSPPPTRLVDASPIAAPRTPQEALAFPRTAHGKMPRSL